MQERVFFLIGPRNGRVHLGDRKKHTGVFSINCLAPTQNTPFRTSKKNVYVPHFVGKEAKKDLHKLFQGGFPGQEWGSQTILGPKKLSLIVFFLPLEFACLKLSYAPETPGTICGGSHKHLVCQLL